MQKGLYLILLSILTLIAIISGCNSDNQTNANKLSENKIHIDKKDPIKIIPGSRNLDTLKFEDKKDYTQDPSFILRDLLIKSEIIEAQDSINIFPAQKQYGRNFDSIWLFKPLVIYTSKVKGHNRYYIYSFNSKKQASVDFRKLVKIYYEGLHSESERVRFKCADFFNYGGDSYFVYKSFIIEHLRQCSENTKMENFDDSKLLKIMYPQMPSDTVFLNNRCGELI